MSLKKIIEALPEEEVFVQILDNNLTNISTNKQGVSRITFKTAHMTATDFMSNSNKMLGLVVWLPRAKLNALPPEVDDP